MADLIDRQMAIDALNHMRSEDFDGLIVNRQKVESMLKALPPVQPERKGTRLSTVCLLCKKPAVTFNTEDDIPYTNYSYCEDCLRKGLKLLREQKKNLQTQPERKTGRWIESNPQDSKLCRLMTCSECGKAYIVNINVPYEDWTEAHKFCVECGADMKGERDE